jgi:uncharacterized protein YggT (Ycf19 family)
MCSFHASNCIFKIWSEYLESALFHIPNYILAALMYTLLGRLVLTFVLPEGYENYIQKAFITLTDPVVFVVRFLTPRAVPHVLLLLFAVVWLFVGRIIFLNAMMNAGLAPVAGVAG